MNKADVYEYSKDATVLYVEDDKNSLEIFSGILDMLFASVDTALNGEEGIKCYQEYHGRNGVYHDVVITDLNMPKKDGIAMIKEIVAQNPKQPIIITSAHNDSDKLMKLIELGVSEFILKPVRNTQFYTVLEKVLKSIKLEKEKEQLYFKQARHASLGEMMDVIAHQWKTPAGIMKLQSKALQMEMREGAISQPRLQEYIDEQLTQVDHIIHTMHEFRSFYKDNIPKKECLLNDLVHSVLVLLREYLHTYSVTVEVSTENEFYIEVYENDYKHLLLNIIQNAVESYEENNTPIEMRTIMIHADDDENGVTLAIEDQAGGIDEEKRELVFNKGFSTKTRGSGVGLYLCKKLIDRMGGRIEVSNIAKGACFRLFIPYKDIYI